MNNLVLGVDVGGTFTDLFLFDEAAGTARVAKVASTRGAEATGFLSGARGIADVAALSAIMHGTTAGTNAILERTGARAGLITTAGFRDVLEMRRRDRRQTWGLSGVFVPVIGRDMRLEVAERTLADGTVAEAVAPDAVREAARALLAQGAEALAIVFLHSYANPANERAALAAAREVWPNEHVAISSDILSEIREFERTSTTALNAMLQPVIGDYLRELDGALREDGFRGAFLIVQSNGGVMDLDAARRLPVRTALSGPAAGVIAAAHIASEAGFTDVITGDVGGTSFDVSLIAGGKPALAAQSTLGFGLVVRTPMIEITTIGAGGGSIARVDGAGLLQVGPESAGANPGPACYGAGGERATVTDAHLLLGRIDAARPMGGRAGLDVAAAERAILRDVGAPLGLDAVAAAAAILRVANARMAGALRLVSIERGHDPKRFALMAFGGGGGLHADALIREVGLSRALIPRFPGVTSALGCVIADMRHDRVRTLNTALDSLDVAALRAEMDAAATDLSAMLDRGGVAFTGRTVGHELDMSYAGQTHTVAVKLKLASDGTGALAIDDVRAAFEAAYQGAYGRVLPGVAIRILNLRSAVTGLRPKLDLAALAPGKEASLERARRGTRLVRFGLWQETALYERLLLPVGATIEGPAVLDQPDATIVVEPGSWASVDAVGNLVLGVG